MRWTEEKVKDVIKNGENSFVEFKEFPLKPEQLAKELVAFSNFKGGTLFLGISDKGTIKGVTEKKVEEWVMNVVSNIIEPTIIPSYQELMISSKMIVIIELELGTAKPYAVKKGSSRSFYIRTGSTCRLADRDQLRRLFQTSGMLQGETLPVSRSGFHQLELLTVKTYFSEYRKFETPSLDQEAEWTKLLKNNEYIIETELNNDVLSIAGCILFAEESQRLLPQAGVSAVAYKGDEKDYDTFERLEINAPLSPKGLIKECILFFQRHLSTEILTSEMQRERIWEIPEDVLREVLLNAVAHRDYTLPSTIEISLFDHRIEITSPGALPNFVTVERMKAGCRVSRNQIITQTLKDYRLIEHMGMGVRNKIIKGMLDFNQKEPEFIVDEYQVKVILYK